MLKIFDWTSIGIFFLLIIFRCTDTVNEHLCDWLKKELGLNRLYQKLYRILEDERGTGDFILAIFREINYLSHEEFRKMNEELVLLEQQPDTVRKKKKGDYLVNNKMYVNAIRMYEDANVYMANQVKFSAGYTSLIEASA